MRLGLHAWIAHEEWVQKTIVRVLADSPRGQWSSGPVSRFHSGAETPDQLPSPLATPRGLFRLTELELQGIRDAMSLHARWKRETRIGEPTSGEARIAWGDPDADDKDKRGRPLSEAAYAARTSASGPPPVQIISVKPGRPLYTPAARLNTRGHYRLVRLSHSADDHTYSARRPELPPAWKTPRLLSLRWGPQGNRLDVNHGHRRRTHAGTADGGSVDADNSDQCFRQAKTTDKAWRHWAPLDDEGHIKADFLRRAGWHPVRAGSTGRPTGRPRKGATGHELIRQRIESKLTYRLEATCATLHRKRRNDERHAYDELACVIAEATGAINRLALAEVLGCSRKTADRLVDHGRALLTQNLPKRGEAALFDPPPLGTA